MVIGSVSGTALYAFSQALGNVSHNLANLSTEGFQRKQASFHELPERAGVGVTFQPDSSAGPIVQDPLKPGEFKTMSNVDMTREISDMIQIKDAFAANVKAFRAEDEMVKRLFDEWA